MPRMMTKRGIVAGLLALATLLATLALRPSHAVGQSPVDPAALNAVARLTTSDWATNSQSGSLNIYTVPAGKRLVIENVFAHMRVLAGAFAVVSVRTMVGGQNAGAEVALVAQGTFGRESRFAATQNMRLYADPNTIVSISYARSVPDATGKLTLGFSGYLIDKP